MKVFFDGEWYNVSMERNDSEIVASCQAGDREQFGLLYDKYVRQIYGFIFTKTSHREIAEDLTSQVFFRALRALPDFDGRDDGFRPWLYRIARNVVIDYYRQQKNDVDLEKGYDIEDSPDAVGQIDAVIGLDEVRKYLDSLTSEQREIIIMRVWDELSYREIAIVVGKSEAACKMAFSRAIAELRRKMPLAAYLMLLMQVI